MRIKFWGVRGSLPAPLRNQEYHNKIVSILKLAVAAKLDSFDRIPDFIGKLPHGLRYTVSGDTTCVQVIGSVAEHAIIIDAGTGIRALGDELMKGPCGEGRGVVSIFFTHTHWDHIQGLPFFKPIYVPGNVINFYSPLADIESRIRMQYNPYFFPVPFDAMAAVKKFHQLPRQNTLTLEKDMSVDFYALRHPGGCYAYRFSKGGSKFIFATDAEFTGGDLEDPGLKIDFFLNADLLAMDAQYTLDESFTKFEWGHTSFTMAVNCGIRWGIKHLVLTHHDPAYTDERLVKNWHDAVLHRNVMRNSSPKIYLAREGLTFQLNGSSS